MIDWDKPIQTRDGRKARVLATDIKDLNRGDLVVAAIDYGTYELVKTFYKDGWNMENARGDSDDIINVPTKRKGVVVVTKDRLGKPTCRILEAKGIAGEVGWQCEGAIATVPIEWSEE